MGWFFGIYQRIWIITCANIQPWITRKILPIYLLYLWRSAHDTRVTVKIHGPLVNYQHQNPCVESEFEKVIFGWLITRYGYFRISFLLKKRLFMMLKAKSFFLSWGMAVLRFEQSYMLMLFSLDKIQIYLKFFGICENPNLTWIHMTFLLHST